MHALYSYGRISHKLTDMNSLSLARALSLPLSRTISEIAAIIIPILRFRVMTFDLTSAETP